MQRADYNIEIIEGVICIEDLNLGSVSVTSDAANLIADLQQQGIPVEMLPVIYRDAAAHWVAIVTRQGHFEGFCSLMLQGRPITDQYLAIELIKDW